MTPAVKLTPYYQGLLMKLGQDHVLWKTVLPAEHTEVDNCETEDPLNEMAHCPVPGLVHKYPDRVLFLVSEQCFIRCQYCARPRDYAIDWGACIDYIRGNKDVRDVLISGGDPLTLSDNKLMGILEQLKSIDHVEMIRIGTKAPVVAPSRISDGIISMLKRYHPLYMSIHFTHPDEITKEVAAACNRLADAGVPLGSQTVLLKGINDDVDTMRRLFTGLLKVRVKPYYLYQCDCVPGSSRFRTPIEKGLDIMGGLQGHISGYAVPKFVVDTPGGKIPLSPDYIYTWGTVDNIELRNYQGKLYGYPIC